MSEHCGCCGCEHEHEHEHGEAKGEALLLPRLGAALVLLAAALYTKLVPLYIAAYLIAGFDVIVSAVKGIIHGRVFSETFLMTVASLGAFAIGEFPEGAAVMIFYGLGEYIQDKAVDKSSDSINELIRLRPDHARLIDGSGERTVAPSEVAVGDIIAVAPGERVPLDGILLSDGAVADTSAITGESLPREYQKGNELPSGIINTRKEIRLKVTHTLENSSTERIFRAVTEARENKSRGERFISRFAAVYTPAVVAAAVLLAVIPSIFLGTPSVWIHRGLVFLVASCPCALVLSVPLTFFSGMGLASRNGILCKGSVHLERLAELERAAFDKTGTLTVGEPSVCSVNEAGVSRDELIRLAACAEKSSDHPIGRAVAELWSGEAEITDFEELTGGVKAVVGGDLILAGNTALTGVPSSAAGTAVHVLKNGEYIGSLYLADSPRPDSAAAVAELKALGIEPAMITGDCAASAEATARELGISEVRSEVLPTEKLDIIRSFDGVTAFVGDGINDSPALSGADVGIAMGGMGREAAMEAADIVIMDDSPSKVPLAVRIARKTRRTAVGVVAFALGVKAAVLILGALGLSGMWLAVFADVGVALIAVAIAVLSCRKI